MIFFESIYCSSFSNLGCQANYALSEPTLNSKSLQIGETWQRYVLIAREELAANTLYLH